MSRIHLSKLNKVVAGIVLMYEVIPEWTIYTEVHNKIVASELKQEKMVVPSADI